MCQPNVLSLLIIVILSTALASNRLDRTRPSESGQNRQDERPPSPDSPGRNASSSGSSPSSVTSRQSITSAPRVYVPFASTPHYFADYMDLNRRSTDAIVQMIEIYALMIGQHADIDHKERLYHYYNVSLQLDPNVFAKQERTVFQNLLAPDGRTYCSKFAESFMRHNFPRLRVFAGLSILARQHRAALCRCGTVFGVPIDVAAVQRLELAEKQLRDYVLKLVIEPMQNQDPEHRHIYGQILLEWDKFIDHATTIGSDSNAEIHCNVPKGIAFHNPRAVRPTPSSTAQQPIGRAQTPMPANRPPQPLRRRSSVGGSAVTPQSAQLPPNFIISIVRQAKTDVNVFGPLRYVTDMLGCVYDSLNKTSVGVPPAPARCRQYLHLFDDYTSSLLNEAINDVSSKFQGKFDKKITHQDFFNLMEFLKLLRLLQQNLNDIGTKAELYPNMPQEGIDFLTENRTKLCNNVNALTITLQRCAGANLKYWVTLVARIDKTMAGFQPQFGQINPHPQIIRTTLIRTVQDEAEAMFRVN